MNKLSQQQIDGYSFIKYFRRVTTVDNNLNTDDDCTSRNNKEDSNHNDLTDSTIASGEDTSEGDDSNSNDSVIANELLFSNLPPGVVTLILEYCVDNKGNSCLINKEWYSNTKSVLAPHIIPKMLYSKCNYIKKNDNGDNGAPEGPPGG